MTAFIAIFAAGAFVGIILCGMSVTHSWQCWLVKTGHAEYYLDENHKRQWRMKEK